MASTKTFVVVEAVDSPKGAMLVRYQTVERAEPDPEEVRVASIEYEKHLEDMDEAVREQFKAQISAMQALNPMSKPSYNVEDKMVICQTPEEVVVAIKDAKEAYEEMRKLVKAGTRLNVNYSSMRPL